MRFSNYYIFFVKALFYLLLIQDKLFILLQLIWDLLATRKKNEPSISCTGQQRLALMGHWKQPYSNFIFCHLNDVSSSSGLFRRRGPYKTYVIRHYWCSLCFFCFCFTHWFLYLFHCFLFIICCLYMVSLTSSVFCLQFQIRKYIAYQFIYILLFFCRVSLLFSKYLPHLVIRFYFFGLNFQLQDDLQRSI